MSTMYAPGIRLTAGGIDLRGAWMGESEWDAHTMERLASSTSTASLRPQTWLAGVGTMLSSAMQRLTPGAGLAATGEVTRGIEQALQGIDDLGVILQDVVNVRSYLQDRPDMLEAMQATATIARERLPEGTRITLRLYRDPEIDDEYLAMYAQPPVLDLETLKTTFDEIARRRAPFIRGRSGRVLVLPDFLAM